MSKMKIMRYHQSIGYPSDMWEDDGFGDWVKYEDVKPLLERIKELENQRCECVDWDEITVKENEE